MKKLLLGLLLTLLTGCGGCNVNWFPKCDDPKNPCATVDPDYPAGVARDAGPG